MMSHRVKWVLAVVLVPIAVLLTVRAFWPGPGVGRLAASDSADDRLQAAFRLGQPGQNPPTPLLTQLANDPDDRVALEAVIALSNHFSPENYHALDTLVNEASKPLVRGAAAAALGKFPQTEPDRLLPYLSDEEADSELRTGAAKGLARICRYVDRRPQTVPHLVQALSHPDPQVRHWAVEGIYIATGHKFPGYNPDKPPATQREVIKFIETKMRSEKMIP